MCDIARDVPGVLGARMLGGGDAGASGAIALPDAVESLKKAVDNRYRCMCPGYSEKYAVHTCRFVQGVHTFNMPGD
jgi:galactokinase